MFACRLNAAVRVSSLRRLATDAKFDKINVSVGANDVATVRMNRPDVHNAFNESLIAELTQAFESFKDNKRVRAVIFAANGAVRNRISFFCRTILAPRIR